MTTTETADRLLWRTARRGGGWAAVLAVVALADTAVTLALPAVLGRAVDEALSPGAVGTAVWLCAALIAASAAIDLLLEWAGGAGSARATAWLRHTFVRHVLAAGPSSRLDPGDTASRMVGGAAEAGQAPVAVIRAAVAVLPPVGAAAALVWIDWPIAVALAVAMPLLVLLLRAFVRDMSGTVRRYLTVQGAMAGRLAEALRGIRTIAAAGTVERETRRVLAPLPELRREGARMWRVQGGVGARGLLAVVALQAAVLAVAGVQLAAGRITAGELVAAAQYAVLAAGLGPLVAQFGRIGRARGAAARASEVLGRPVPSHGTEELPPGPGALEFRRVRAGVLADVTLLIPGGAAVAVVGRSGSGKSLLAALAGRLADPDSGQVLLDGVELPRLTRAALRGAVGYAFARPDLFGATVLDAIAFGSPGAPEHALHHAARAACADPFVRRLPAGYATPLAETPLSGGQAQRLGLARAFAHGGRLLILDDATSSLDTATEVEIGRALFEAFTDRTRLITAHRASTAARADLVVWLEAGRVRAVAPHHALWNDPAYRAVFATAPEDPDE
ncbi:ABC transporter ATP-binding protein [Thermomonospora cellulosilytica]|uniref:ATP-binding cassette subfamily B protein n=1 Tax=Thermomonospora cellulosilytica TaxID=1411118 RepID=A0A7W3RBT8_9ACTN|nr:ABC transporter ATP-binding protein [Thermomonospora cellulosilytica]MBA9007382.1 ATP-binding cassette subfamily B protein [Thermomonospora cellulosilytica]